MQFSENGNFAQAITELELAIQNEPGWVMPFFTLGVVYGNQGELDRAIQAWERATQLDVNFAKAHYNPRRRLFTQGRERTIHCLAT